MAPKTNSKAVAGRAKKAEAASAKDAAAAAAKEAAEAAQWDKGAKGKGAAEAKAEKAAEAARKKAEKERLLAEEEASLPKEVKKAPKAGAKKDAKKPALAAAPPGTGLDDAISSFSASNIDDALEALTLATEKTDNATVGSKAAGLERHPERRYKAAFEAYKEREMPRIRAERPGLRKQQYENELHDEFKKHPDNPFNQLTVAYDASKEEKLEALKAKRTEAERRLGA